MNVENAPIDHAPARGCVLLVGLGPTTATALEALAARFTVLALVREGDADSDPVIARARELGVRVIPDAAIAAIDAAVDDLRPDCVVVSSFHRILPDALLSKCPFVNVHYALLPKYRGRANVNWAILNGERATGISIHEMAPGLDAGNILFQAAVPIEPDDDVTRLYDRLNGLQGAALSAAVERLLSGDHGEPQDERQATYGCTRLPDDGEIDWSAPTAAVHNLVRSLTPPFPGAFTYFEGRRLTVWRARPVSDAPRYDGRVPGRVVRVSRAEGSVDVLTGDGVLRILEVHPDGGDRVAAAQVVRSVKATLGLRTADLLRRIEQLERRVSELESASRQSPLPAELDVAPGGV
jgi:methionyl-tRNA formyltransferase